MVEKIEKLLILQDRDRRLRRLKGELAEIEPERQVLKAKASGAQSGLENAKTKVKEIEAPKDPTGGGSDDVGDISWNLPMVYLRYPANIPNLPGNKDKKQLHTFVVVLMDTAGRRIGESAWELDLRLPRIGA